VGKKGITFVLLFQLFYFVYGHIVHQSFMDF
jgi:hypothetical protein